MFCLPARPRTPLPSSFCRKNALPATIYPRNTVRLRDRPKSYGQPQEQNSPLTHDLRWPKNVNACEASRWNVSPSFVDRLRVGKLCFLLGPGRLLGCCHLPGRRTGCSKRDGSGNRRPYRQRKQGSLLVNNATVLALVRMVTSHRPSNYRSSGYYILRSGPTVHTEFRRKSANGQAERCAGGCCANDPF